MHMPHYLLNNITLHLLMTHSKEQLLPHVVAAAPDYKIVLQDICLDVRCIHVAPVVSNSHAAGLLKGNSAKYPLKHTDVLSFFMLQGQLNTLQDNLFLGQFP